MPAFPELLVHHPVNIMKVNCLERFQELVGSVEKARPLVNRKRADILQTNPPDALQLRVLHERFGHVAQGSGRGVLRSELGHADASMDLHREVQYRQNDSDRAD